MYPPHVAAAKMKDRPVRNPNGHDLCVRTDRHQSQKVKQKADTATDSLSKPPATERMMCAGMIAMTKPAATAAPELPEVSYVSRARRIVATPPSHDGTRQHTLFRLVGPKE